MQKHYKVTAAVFFFFSFAFLFSSAAHAWHDETHLAVAKAAGYYKWYNAAGPDLAKLKAGRAESRNHYHNNYKNKEITAADVLAQIAQYNDMDNAEGHLYGAIIASVQDYISTTLTGKYAEYHLAFCAHYITDLSQPLHNIPYNDFNRTRHAANDGIVEKEVLANVDQIIANMRLVRLRPDQFKQDLAEEIARIANGARHLGERMQKENRNMTKAEAYKQLGQGASLLAAVIQYVKKDARKK